MYILQTRLIIKTMSSLQYTERNLLEKILGMKTGYVSDFSDRTFQEFVLEQIGIDILTEPYEENGTSKANRLRTFWKKESDEITVALTEALLEYALGEKTDYDRELSAHDENLFIEARKIVQRLKDESGDVPKDISSFSPGLTSRVDSSLKYEEIKKSLVAFLSDSRFVQQKRKIETIRDHFPALNESELRQLLSEIGAICYRGNNSELWGPSLASSHAKSVLIAGDYIAGDKVGRDKKSTDFSQNVSGSDIPLWLKWAVAIVTILALLWGVYTYFVPNWSNTLLFAQAPSVNTDDVATSTIKISEIFSRYNDMNRAIDRQNFLKSFIGVTVSGAGSYNDLAGSYGTDSTFYLYLNVSGTYIACGFYDVNEDTKRKLDLLRAGSKVSFFGTFMGSTLNEGNSWFIRDCVFVN